MCRNYVKSSVMAARLAGNHSTRKADRHGCHACVRGVLSGFRQPFRLIAPMPVSRAFALPPPRPIILGGVCGWVHGSGAQGVLMCGAAGFEASAVYQSWRVLADIIAARGYTVLRFDYPGEGDSADPPDGFFSPAIAAIRASAAWLQDATGTTAFDVVALRLGALLAAEALADCPPARLVSMAPVHRGKAHIREMKAAARLFASQPGREDTQTESGINLCGFVLSQADCDRLDTLAPPVLAASSTLVVLPEGQDGPDHPSAQSIAFDGYSAMMTPAEAVPPLAVFTQIADWLGEADAGSRAELLAEFARLETPAWRETRLHFGPGNRLAGTLCEPIVSPAKTCVVTANAGSNPRFGWARGTVDHARALAEAGIASFRFDLSGIGDSPWIAGSARKALYGLPHGDDMRAAVDCMVARGYGRPILAGLCSGGYLALHAAHADPRVGGVVAVNVLKLIWHHGVDDLDEIERSATQASRQYGAQALSASAWKRVLRGEIGAERLFAVARMMTARIARKLGERVGYEGVLPQETRQVRAMLRDLSARGVRVSFVHTDMDASRDEADRHFGTDARFARALPGVTIDIIPRSDHEMTPKQARDRLRDLLIDRAKEA